MRRLALSLLLALLAAPSWGQASRDFDGSNDVIRCGDIDALEGIDNLTCGCWARLDDVDAVAGGLVSKRDSAGFTTWLLRKNASEQAEWAVFAGSSVVATGATTFDAAVWNFFVGTYDRSLGSQRVKVYLNGAQDGALDGTDAAIGTNAEAVIIGQQATARWDGQIAHCFCEARTWSAVEIMEAYRGGLTKPQMAAGGTGGYWPGWDNGATPATYIGQGLFAGVCSATNHPAVSSDGPPVFIPGGGQ